MTFAFHDITVTTWRHTADGRQVWHVRGGDDGELEGEFALDRLASVVALHELGVATLAAVADGRQVVTDEVP